MEQQRQHNEYHLLKTRPGLLGDNEITRLIESNDPDTQALLVKNAGRGLKPEHFTRLIETRKGVVLDEIARFIEKHGGLWRNAGTEPEQEITILMNEHSKPNRAIQAALIRVSTGDRAHTLANLGAKNDYWSVRYAAIESHPDLIEQRIFDDLCRNETNPFVQEALAAFAFHRLSDEQKSALEYTNDPDVIEALKKGSAQAESAISQEALENALGSLESTLQGTETATKDPSPGMAP